jgi:ABC-type transport system involved in multi-copper enzyme maturation permease subunit
MISNWAQNPNPFIALEIRRRMRSNLSMTLFCSYILIVALAVTFLILMQVPFFSNRSPGMLIFGKVVFGFLFSLQIGFVAIAAPAITVGVVASEFERKTFELLRVTTLRTRDILLGKLSSRLLFLIVLVLAAQPLVLLLGYFSGIGLSELIMTGSLIATTSIAFASFGLFFSTISRRTSAAGAFSYLAIGIILGGIPLFLTFFGSISAGFLSTGSAGVVAETALLIGFYPLIAANPFTAVIGSGIILVETGSLWYYWLEMASGTQYLIISPWISYSVGYLLLSLVLIRVCKWMLNQKLRK